MIETARMAPVSELAEALGRMLIRCVRIPEPTAAIRGVVMHAPGDPPPSPDLLVLCTTPADGLPDCVAVVVRESDVAATLVDASSDTAIFAGPEATRWSDIYDRVHLAVGESFGQLAEHDAFHLADAIAVATGGAVAIEDARRRVVAFSTVPGQRIDDVRRQGILGRQVPDHVEREKWYARMWNNTEVSEFTDGTESTGRLAIAVRSGGEPLGSIWVVGTRDALNPGADEILTRSVDAVAACLAYQDHFAARGREARRQLMRRLLGIATDGPDAPPSMSLPGPTLLVALYRDAEPGGRELVDARLADILSLYAHRYQGSGLAAVLDERVYGLLPVSNRARFETQLRSVVSRIGPVTGWAVVSDVLHGIEEVPSARRKVDRLLALRHRRDTDRLEIGFVSDEDEIVRLAELAEAVRGLDALRHGAMNRMAEYDHEHGTVYVATLRAWFACSGDAAAAAEQLHVHANTFRYRMTRATSLFGLRLDHPDERLLLHLQLRLAEFD